MGMQVDRRAYNWEEKQPGTHDSNILFSRHISSLDATIVVNVDDGKFNIVAN